MSSDIVYMAVLIFCILHPIKVVTFVSWQCITVHYNKLEESLIYFDLLFIEFDLFIEMLLIQTCKIIHPGDNINKMCTIGAVIM